MSAPVIWIVLPALFAVLLALVSRWKYVVFPLGIFSALILAGLAWIVPVGVQWEIGFLTINLSDTLSILGRQFVVQSPDTPIIILFYTSLAFWLAGALMIDVSNLFVAVGFGIASLSTAVLAVEPFLYAALFIELVVLVSVPILVSPGLNVGRGVLRFITFETLGMPFILLTGWLISGLIASPIDSDSVLMANFFLGLGFAFLLGIFPFHTWVPMITEEAHPYIAVFLLFMLPLIIILFGLGLIDQYIWLRSSPNLYAMLRFAGGSMLLVGGLWAAFQRSLGRIVGFAVMIEIGMFLLVIGSDAGTGAAVPLLGLFFAMLVPWGLSLGVWALAASTILRTSRSESRRKFKIDFGDMQGLAWNMPIAAGSLVLATFSLAGLPLLAGFPPRLALWNGLGQEYLLSSIAILLGSVGLMVGGVRMLRILVKLPEEIDARSEGNGWRFSETRGEAILLVLGVCLLVLLGLFPQWFAPYLGQLTDAYLHLGP